MKKFQVNIQAGAHADIEAAVEWIAERSPVRAARWHGRLLQAIQSLGSLPERCGLAPESETYGEPIRQLLYGKRRGIYRILFVVRGDTVSVLHVRHGAQQFLDP